MENHCDDRRGDIASEMTGIYEYVTSRDRTQVKDLLNTIGTDAFKQLYGNSVDNASEEEKRIIDKEVAKAIDDCCEEGAEGALRLKADLCLGSELCFSWTYPELEDCLRKLIGEEDLPALERKVLKLFLRKRNLLMARSNREVREESVFGMFALSAYDMGNSLGDSKEAYKCYLQARYSGEQCFVKNSITECFLSAVQERIDKLSSILGYPDDGEVAIESIRRIKEEISKLTDGHFARVRVNAAEGNKCRIEITSASIDNKMSLITIPESSFCAADPGLTLFAEDVKYVAIQKKDFRWVFDSFIATNYLDQDEKLRAKLTFYLLSEAVVQIDAALPMHLRTNNEDYQLEGEAADSSVLWMPIELSAAHSLNSRMLDQTWAWAQAEIEDQGLTISDTEVNLQELSLFTCTEYDTLHYALFCAPLEREALVREADVSDKTIKVQYYRATNVYTSETSVSLPFAVLLNNAAALRMGGGKNAKVIGPARNRVEKLMLKPIDALELSVRAYNYLYRAGIRTVGELCGLTIGELRMVRNLGPKAVDEVIRKVEEYGLPAAFLDPPEEGDDR